MARRKQSSRLKRALGGALGGAAMALPYLGQEDGVPDYDPSMPMSDTEDVADMDFGMDEMDYNPQSSPTPQEIVSQAGGSPQDLISMLIDGGLLGKLVPEWKDLFRG